MRYLHQERIYDRRSIPVVVPIIQVHSCYTQASQDEGLRKQQAATLSAAHAVGQSRFEGAGTDQAAGRIVS